MVSLALSINRLTPLLSVYFLFMLLTSKVKSNERLRVLRTLRRKHLINFLNWRPNGQTGTLGALR